MAVRYCQWKALLTQVVSRGTAGCSTASWLKQVVRKKRKAVRYCCESDTAGYCQVVGRGSQVLLTWRVLAQ